MTVTLHPMTSVVTLVSVVVSVHVVVSVDASVDASVAVAIRSSVIVIVSVVAYLRKTEYYIIIEMSPKQLAMVWQPHLLAHTLHLN